MEVLSLTECEVLRQLWSGTSGPNNGTDPSCDEIAEQDGETNVE
jgi:hypothetical protein